MGETEIGEVTMTIEWVKTRDEVGVVGGVDEAGKGMINVVRGNSIFSQCMETGFHTGCYGYQ